MENNYCFKPSENYSYLLANAKKSLSWKNKHEITNFQEWQEKLKSKLMELIHCTSDDFQITSHLISTHSEDLYEHLSYVIKTSPQNDVPVQILIPNLGLNNYPVMICLQGHTPGAHISMGVAKSLKDEEYLEGGRDFALQAVKNGFIAVVVEQKCFGQRKDDIISQRAPSVCYQSAVKSLLLGSTLIAERVNDIIKIINFLETLDIVQNENICIMGNSGGGTISLYSAALDSRIKLTCVSCAFCTYEDSIFSLYHCLDNIIPNILQYAEMADVAGLICPRNLIIVAGQKDHLFPIGGVKKAYHDLNEIYHFETKNNCSLLIGEEGHRFYPTLAWPLINSLINIHKL
ncbi:hypothetical protein COV12_00305 [Candidatus Woesearchaeota archaeon CG10_big_fil_rev_8_21_14_0_10_32_24]|nr:MAG: hypothetical protein COV12_00305 [Candidatus Woesearchaeota archaeon CG10_big_fil_rev_8_21_14_0_10_32_24]